MPEKRGELVVRRAGRHRPLGPRHDGDGDGALQQQFGRFFVERIPIVGEEQVEASAGDLLSLEGMDAETARTLASKGVHTTEDLAELDVDELTEMAVMDAERAKQLIMAARAPWFAQG